MQIPSKGSQDYAPIVHFALAMVIKVLLQPPIYKRLDTDISLPTPVLIERNRKRGTANPPSYGVYNHAPLFTGEIYLLLNNEHLVYDIRSINMNL